MTDPRSDDVVSSADAVVVGDGPAGSALAHACARAGVDVVLVGDDEPWTATYGVWIDELERLDGGTSGLFVHEVEPVAWAAGRHELGRGYGIVDNDALRRRLRDGVVRRHGRATRVGVGLGRHRVEMGDGPAIDTRLVVDATGWPPRFAQPGTRGPEPAWQTAFGVVLADPPPGDLGQPTLMDFRAVDAPEPDPAVPTFAYGLPVADGWLVEETVLAARPAVDPDRLVPRLAARLDRTVDELLAGAVRTETVAIPMGGPVARPGRPILAFGAAAGYVNPISGYSLGTSLRAAPRVASAIRSVLVDEPTDLVAAVDPVWREIWPPPALRTRALHDYGLELLARLDAADTRAFFELFFAQPAERWAPYLRVDASPAEVSRLMTALFRSAPWRTRRRLAAGNPLSLARLLRP